MIKKKPYDGVVVAAHYTPQGEIDWVRAFVRHGFVFSDRVNLDRAALVERLQAGKRFKTGQRQPYQGSDFTIKDDIRLIDKNSVNYYQERSMLEVTEAAASNINEYLKQQNVDAAVRITMMSGGCSGPALGLALDEAKEDDLTFEQDGVNFLVEKGLAETCGTITVDYLESSSGCGCSTSCGRATPPTTSPSSHAWTARCGAGSCA